MPYNPRMKGMIHVVLGGLMTAIVFGVAGCVTELPPLVDPTLSTGNVVVGRVITVLTGERSRRYLPQTRFFEVENRDSSKRFQVGIESPDQRFVIDLPPGKYQLTKVQISEGPFLSMADLGMAFSVDPGATTYVGTWQFGVGSPGYGRNVVVSLIADQGEMARVRDFLNERYPNLNQSSIVEKLPEPSQLEARLYEVMPYPRYPRYFRRHWW